MLGQSPELTMYFWGMEQREPQVWLISGASRGIGKAIAHCALERGDLVAAGVRKMQDVDDLVAQFGDQCLPVQLDVTLSEDCKRAYEAVISKFGKLDNLINNAGYGLWGMMEELSMEQIRHQMEVNFFGLVSLTREVVPGFRNQKSGMIINISSLAGLRGMQGLSAYNASKFAVEGFTEALSQEMSFFGVRVGVLEPGPYRTDWAGNSLVKTAGVIAPDISSPYQELNGVAARRISMSDGKQPGDPKQIGEVLFEASRAHWLPVHMLFGDVCIEGWEQRRSRFDEPEFMSYFPHDKNTFL
jgi:NAD(P)-dependent dehydrogenase (short-subunit alcohol dehydrogenase family)